MDTTDSAYGDKLVRLDTFDTAVAVDPSAEDDAKRRFMTLILQTAHRNNGNIGHVLRATNTSGEVFAVKLLKDNVILSGQAPDRSAEQSAAHLANTAALFEEYRHLCTVSHLRGFPRVYGYGSCEDDPLILMEWVEGTSLKQALPLLPHDASGGLTTQMVAAVGNAVLRALLMTQGLVNPVVHRDLSPANIMFRTTSRTLEQQIAEADAQKHAAAQSQDFEKAASFRDREQELKQQLAKANEQWEKQLEENRVEVDQDKVAEVVALMTGVPVQRIAQAEGSRLRAMAPQLKSEIIGQDKAIDKIVKAIQRNRVGLKDPNKPIGTFMFLGPTGVGKTHLAKKLAEYMFDSSDTLIRIDMSEYMEKFTVSRLVGAPPGYVGYEEGGQLTEKVRRRPYSVVLLDEIEKAHPDVFNLLLQVLDEGRLTDSLGRRVDFKNTLIIMTSNIGTRQLKDFGAGIGFNIRSDEKEKDYSQGVLQKALNKAFAPEFLNRIDDIIMFDALDKDAIFKIIGIELRGFLSRMEKLGYTFEITEEAKNYIASKGYDQQFGARPLKRAIQRYLEDPLAELIINSELKAGDTIKVDYDKVSDKIVTSVESPTPDAAAAEGPAATEEAAPEQNA